ncbi:MAG TPA: ABC transporter ATP-binding protein [Blastocatellia bacterium]|nr:ABC transporter ATP-binding protein [Blastocatellia bacterium]
MTEEYEVELLNVSKRFADTVAVDSVTMRVTGGEFLTLLGPSGCGKTTLLRMIAGFETPDEGRVMLGGRDVTGVPPFKRDVTTVFQQYALFPHLNVFENVAFGLKQKRVARQSVKTRVAEALELVKMGGLDRRLPSELSGGQQQRVALARALVLHPRVLLLDEPLAALDLKLRKQMQVELKSLQQRVGISFVYVTHDQEEALTMSDRIVVMNAGRIEQTGRADEIYERPQTEFVAGFIGVSNIINGTVTGRRDEYSIIKLGDCEVEALGNDTKVGDAIRLMVRPEKIVMTFDSSDAALTATIESAVYLGDSTHWKLKLRDGQSITVLEQNRAASRPVQDRVGSEVRVSWNPDGAVLLKR